MSDDLTVVMWYMCVGAGGLTLKEIAQKLAETSNTVRLLEEKLKEKETTINRLEQEKGKLESYAKRTITTFKVHYFCIHGCMMQYRSHSMSRYSVVMAGCCYSFHCYFAIMLLRCIGQVCRRAAKNERRENRSRGACSRPGGAGGQKPRDVAS